MTQVAVVFHPIKVADPEALADLVRKRCAELGWPQPSLVETSAEDPGFGQTRQALADGAELVIAAGGDGTVRAVAQAIVGSSAKLGVVPQGTGNLLGRNLGLPTDIPEALEVALTGDDRVIDVGKVVGGDLVGGDVVGAEVAGQDDGVIFTVMSGIGLDAAMVRDAPEPLKKRVGWLAYLVGIVRGLRGGRVHVEISVDGAEPLRRSARAVLVGNVGELQGGMDLLPESRPDNGRLDVAVLAARGPIEWLAVLVGSLLGKHPSRGDRRLERVRGGHIVVRTRTSQAREVDGDLLPDGRDLEVEVLPGALTVRVPHREASATDSKEK